MQNPASPVTTDPTTSATSSWRLWIGSIKHAQGGGFVHGCAARSFHAPGWNDEATFTLSANAQLTVHQATVTDDAFAVFHDKITRGTIDTAAVSPSNFQLRVAAARVIVQEALGQSGVPTELYYSLPDVEALVGREHEPLASLLSVLQQQLNLPFPETYASHLGNFEIFRLHPWLDGQSPFLIEAVPNTDLNRDLPQTSEICRTPQVASATHAAHLVGRSHGDVVLNRIIKLSPSERRVPTPAPCAYPPTPNLGLCRVRNV
ncbi:hypothetical protein [Bradyrhizobium sp. Ec3.3]|uniref:hypothetical protein n=1 Tax=Bradyrhizobium sp. Ec3.3 TaxID=189753 RepID=UPI0012EB3630|nr:hypothetical protein [Bradyrhizobium sp. Ec3.3]